MWEFCPDFLPYCQDCVKDCYDRLGLGGRKVVIWLGSGKELDCGDILYVTKIRVCYGDLHFYCH